MVTESTKGDPKLSIGVRIEALKKMALDELLRQKDVIILEGQVWKKHRLFGGQAIYFAPPGTEIFLFGKILVDGVWESAELISTF